MLRGDCLPYFSGLVMSCFAHTINLFGFYRPLMWCLVSGQSLNIGRRPSHNELAQPDCGITHREEQSDVKSLTLKHILRVA